MEIIDHFIDEIVDEIVVGEYKDCTQCGISKLKKCFSKRKASKDGLQSNCKDCRHARYQENKDEILAQQAEDRAKPENKAKRAERYQENKDEIKAHNAKPERKAKKAEYDAAHNAKPERKAKQAEYNAVYRAKPETKTKINSRGRKRRKTDEGYRIEVNLRNRLTKAMKGKKKSASTLRLCGLESGTVINDYLNMKSPWFKERAVPSEKLAKDHMIPCKKYDLTKPDHEKACFHYINLQLLTELDNKRKGDKVPEGFDFESTLKKQLDLIARIEKDKLTYQQVLEMQKAGELYEVKGYEV